MTPTPAPPHTLPRVLGPWLATAIVVGCVIGTGVFKKGRAVSEAVPETGPAIAVWVVVGLLTLCGAMALAEVASLFPQAGGNYIFLRQAYGRLFGFLWGWVEFWFLRCASCAALASVFAESLNDVLKLALDRTDPVLDFWPRQTAAAVVVTLLGLLAARGTKLGAGVQLAVTVIKIGSLVALMVLPIVVLALAINSPVRPDVANFRPVWPDWATLDSGKYAVAFAVAMVAVMWPYNGWSNVASIAGEVREPQRNLPIAFVGGVLLLIVIYSLVNVSYYLVIPAAEMKTLTDTPVATEACRRMLGPVGTLIASAAVMVSVFGALGGNMLVGPRGVYALSRDGLAPGAFARVHAQYQTPFAATILMTAVTVGFIYAVAAYTRVGLTADPNKPPFDVITDFVVFGAGAFETLAVASIFVFRRTHPPAAVPLPYRCPGYPVVPTVFVVCMVAVLGNMLVSPDQRDVALIGLAFIGVGAVVYAAAFTRRG